MGGARDGIFEMLVQMASMLGQPGKGELKIIGGRLEKLRKRNTCPPSSHSHTRSRTWRDAALAHKDRRRPRVGKQERRAADVCVTGRRGENV
jgi:hypothetical protein